MSNTEQLKANIETIATEQGKSPIQVITELQAASAKLGESELLDALCDLKWEYIA